MLGVEGKRVPPRTAGGKGSAMEISGREEVGMGTHWVVSSDSSRPTRFGGEGEPSTHWGHQVLAPHWLTPCSQQYPSVKWD